MNCIYTLNKTAAYVWDLIDGKRTIAQIKDKILSGGYDTTKEKTDNLMKTFIKELKEIKAVIKDKGKKIKDKKGR
ncbi:MAG: PqqD family protein [Candidatus Omnitrophica bacterium]|nr:PqqD family protein [Candidatus Omnitrophota bacterium]MBU1524162.1 PqqD family protein [Candidatus Omnitrophota bacterium]MBU2436955.1 PqqD family protein [Candidatus Omnitrophota bacterium]